MLTRGHVLDFLATVIRRKKDEKQNTKKNQFDITNFYSLKTVSKPKGVRVRRRRGNFKLMNVYKFFIRDFF